MLPAMKTEIVNVVTDVDLRHERAASLRRLRLLVGLDFCRRCAYEQEADGHD